MSGQPISPTWGSTVGGPDRVVPVLAALANGTRLRIVVDLAGGPRRTAELAELLEQPSTGQRSHHLRERLAAGVVAQPVRGTYALDRRRVVPVPSLLSAAVDLAVPSAEEDVP